MPTANQCPSTETFDRGLKELAARGLNWLAFVPLGCGAPAPDGVHVEEDSGLLLFLALGPTFGAQTPYASGLSAQSFDARSIELASAFTTEFVRPTDPSAELVYPAGTSLDLRSWLAAGRVQYATPLGIGIRPDCGPWLAVRAAVWTRGAAVPLATLQERYPPLPAGPSPCESCETKPCITSCPPGALDRSHGPPTTPANKSLSLCLDYRLERNSMCSHQCLARSACPVGSASRYPNKQMAYHYGASLVTIRKWRSASAPCREG